MTSQQFPHWVNLLCVLYTAFGILNTLLLLQVTSKNESAMDCPIRRVCVCSCLLYLWSRMPDSSQTFERRHAMAVGALVPPGATRVAIRIATRVATVYTNASKRRREAILANLCTLLRPRACPQRRHSPTVYTNAPKRRGEARSSHLCTLLRSQGHPQPKSTAQQCTRMPQNGSEGPL